MKVKTYGIYNLTEWHGKVKAGTIEVNVSFTGGTASPSGAQPAYMVTKDPIVQFVIENSKEFKDGLINLVFVDEVEGNHRRMAIPKPVDEKPAPMTIGSNTFAPLEDPQETVNAMTAVETAVAVADNGESAEDGMTIVEVTDIDSARDYIAEKFNIARSTIRYKSNVLEKAAELKIKFVGIED